MELSLDDKPSPVLSLAQNIVFEDNFHRKFNAVDILISALDKDIKKETGAEEIHRYLHSKVLDNIIFSRKLGLFSRMSEHPETGIELYGTDYPTHPEFFYDKEFVKDLYEINNEVNRFIGRLIKKLSEGDTFEV